MTRAVPGRSQPSQPILVHAVTVAGTPAVKVSGTSTAGRVGRSDPITDGASCQSCWKIAHAAREVHRTKRRARGRGDASVMSYQMGRLGIEPRTY